MNAKTNARIVVQLLIALEVYTLFDAESLAESWKLHGAPVPLADSLSLLGKNSGLTGVHNRIRDFKEGYQDIDAAACLLAMRTANDILPGQSQTGKHADLHPGTVPKTPQTGMAPEPLPHPALQAADKEHPTAEHNLPDRDNGREIGGEAPAPVQPGARSDGTESKGKEESPSAGDPSREAGQPQHAGPARLAKQDTAGTDLPETGGKNAGASPTPQENLPNHPTQAQPAQAASGSSESPESDPAAKALRELLQQQNDRDPKPLPQADNAGSGHSGATEGGTREEGERNDGPHAVSDLLTKAYYAHVESPEQEYKRRTESKVMFEKPLSRNYSVLLAGDSFMEEMTLSVGRGSYYRKSGIVFHSIARYSTGLTSIKDWNWQEKLAEGIEKYRPDIVLILLGANDMMGIVEDKKILTYKSRNWENKYRERAEALLDTAMENNVMPIWIGLPVMTHEPFKTGIPIISRLQEEACTDRNAVYVSTMKTLADANGEYQAYRMDARGKKLRLRKKDKCHIAADGMLLVLDEVIPYIRSYVEYRETMDKPSQGSKED